MKLTGIAFLTGLSAVALAGRLNADVITSKDGHATTGTVTRVEADGVFISIGAGEMKIFNADIARVAVDRPAEYEAGLAALKAGNFSAAIAGIKPVVDRYAGVPVSWVAEAMQRLAEAYIGAQDLASAKAVTDRIAKLYPQLAQSTGGGLSSVRLLMAQKNYSAAADALQRTIDPILKAPAPTAGQEATATDALLLLGDCQRALNKPEDALDSYLAVVALYDVDPGKTAWARYKAGQTFEQLGNWKRAKGLFEELLAESPTFAQADDVKARLKLHAE